jgi:hypothetical protein
MNGRPVTNPDPEKLLRLEIAVNKMIPKDRRCPEHIERLEGRLNAVRNPVRPVLKDAHDEQATTKGSELPAPDNGDGY